MTRVIRQSVFGTEVISQAEQLDLNFQIGMFIDFESESTSVQATCMVGDDLIHAFSSEKAEELAIWIKDIVILEIERNQKAIDNANTI